MMVTPATLSTASILALTSGVSLTSGVKFPVLGTAIRLVS